MNTNRKGDKKLTTSVYLFNNSNYLVNILNMLINKI